MAKFEEGDMIIANRGGPNEVVSYVAKVIGDNYFLQAPELIGTSQYIAFPISSVDTSSELYTGVGPSPFKISPKFPWGWIIGIGVGIAGLFALAKKKK